MEKTETWVKIAVEINEIPFAENKIATIKIGDKKICITKINEVLKAFSATCPHAGGDLSKGFFDKKENIICPVHAYRFNLNNGRDTDGEGYFLKILRVKENEEGIFLEMK